MPPCVVAPLDHRLDRVGHLLVEPGRGRVAGVVAVPDRDRRVRSRRWRSRPSRRPCRTASRACRTSRPVGAAVVGGAEPPGRGRRRAAAVAPAARGGDQADHRDQRPLRDATREFVDSFRDNMRPPGHGEFDVNLNTSLYIRKQMLASPPSRLLDTKLRVVGARKVSTCTTTIARCARGGCTTTAARPRCCGSTPCPIPSPRPASCACGCRRSRSTSTTSNASPAAT